MPPPRPMASSKRLPTKPPVSTLVEIQPRAVLISPWAQLPWGLAARADFTKLMKVIIQAIV